MLNPTKWYKKTIMKNLIICALLAILILLLFSCGTRKTDISYQKQFKDSITIENHYTQATKTVLMDVFTAKPIDALKPMWIDGKKYQNAVISSDKSKVRYRTININQVHDIYRTHDISKTKNVTKTDNANLWIGFFAVFGTLLVIFLILKKHKIL